MFFENILSKYASYTYGFKLYALDPETHSRIMSTNVDYYDIHAYKYVGMKKAIVVETGVTNMSIDDVSISSRPSTTNATFLNKLSFKITQPKGFSFVESMVAAGTICGWESFLSSPFLIFEISFKGWQHKDAHDKLPKVIQTISIPIQISTVNTELEGSGTRYSIEAAILFNWERQQYSTTLGAVTVPNCNTFGEFLDKLSTRLNEENDRDRTNSDVHKTNHYFEADSTLRNIRLGAISSDEGVQTNTPAGTEVGQVQGGSYTIPNQMTIPKIIESVLISTKEIQDALKLEDTNEFFGHTFRITPKYKIKKFNYTMGDYSYDITWVITRVPTHLIKNTENSVAVSDKAWKILTDNDDVSFAKLYTHHYIGSNSEVLNANLNLSNLYTNKLTRYNEFFANDSNHGATTRGITTESESRKEYLKQLQDNPSRTTAGQYSNTSKNRYDAQVFYVDDVTVADMKSLSQLKLLYHFSRDTQATVPQETSVRSASSRSQDVADSLRNIRNQLKLSAIELSLEIRGDPFWITPLNTNYHDSNRVSSLKPNFIGFVSGFPNEAQERGIRNDYVFSGVYIVNNITSSFNNGKFTQRLECARFQELESDKFIDNINKLRTGENYNE